jgi:hypothetical protein
MPDMFRAGIGGVSCYPVERIILVISATPNFVKTREISQRTTLVDYALEKELEILEWQALQLSLSGVRNTMGLLLMIKGTAPPTLKSGCRRTTETGRKPGPGNVYRGLSRPEWSKKGEAAALPQGASPRGCFMVVVELHAAG